ncbi:MAG: TonB-dependent receptor plug domain-containing protein [Ekhidna sp.]
MRALVSTIVFLTVCTVNAQSSKSFFEAIESYEKDSGIKFSFDPDLLNLVDSSKAFTANNLVQFIQEVENGFPLGIELVDEKYYTISALTKTYRLVAKDLIDDILITEDFGVQVIVNDQPLEMKFNEDHWEFDYKPNPNHLISVFSQGYEKKTLTVKELFNNQNLAVDLDLPTTRLSTVVVEDYLTKGINLIPSSQRIQVKVSDLPLLPGETDGDIFASISALPGITNPDGRAGNLLIRGSETDQTLILYDNIPIYHRGHYYGTISPYNPKVIDDVEVYRSGFHPRYGDRVGGAILINSGDAAESSSYGVGANTLFGVGFGKLRFNEKWSGTFGVRNSYSRKFESPKLREISESVFAATALEGPNGKLTDKVEVLFRDYSGTLRFNPNESNSIGLSFLYTLSDIMYMPPIPVNVARRAIENSYDNVGANLSWHTNLGQKWTSDLSGTYSAYNYQFNIAILAPGVMPIFSRNSIDDLNVIEEFSRKGRLSEMQFGVDYKWQKVDLDYQNFDRDSSEYAVKESNDSHTISSFANYEYYGLDRWYFELGFRGTYFSALNDFSISPRVLVNYDISNSVTLKGSIGRYNQFLSQVKNLEFSSGGFDNELWTLANEKSGFVIRGTQAMIGGVINISDWIFDVEYFHKTANDMTIYEDRSLNPRSDYFTMDQEVYGVDLLLKKQVAEDASIWFGYSYHDSKISLDTTDQVTYKSKFVQPHVLFIGGALKKNRWKLSAAWRYASGLNAQSLDIAYAEVLFDRGAPPPPGGPPPPNTPPLSNPFEDLPERYPSVHSLDLSLSYKIPVTEQRKWSATFGLSLLNTLNQENLTDRVFRGQNGFIDREAVGFAPNLMVLVEW